jgi:hypothetical protein
VPRFTSTDISAFLRAEYADRNTVRDTDSSNATGNAPVFTPLLYPITELNEMAECREVTFSKESSKSCADEEAGKKPTFSRPLETKHCFEARGYDTDYDEPTARIAISVIPARCPIVSDSVIAPKPFSGTATEDPEAWVEYFDRYARYKNMNNDEQAALFAMFMRDCATQWLFTFIFCASAGF